MTNLEAKQESIKKAYGEHWERLNNFINEDGVFIGDTDMISDELFNEWAFISSSKDINSEKLISGSRPKSLKGIENNNGWIRIESDEDLPKNKNVWICTNNNRILISSKAVLNWVLKNPDNKITHYQPIEKPKPPIY